MALTVISARIVGLCSSHRSPSDEVPRYKDGREIPANELACFACMLSGGD